eukprot:g977.t1
MISQAISFSTRLSSTELTFGQIQLDGLTIFWGLCVLQIVINLEQILISTIHNGFVYLRPSYKVKESVPVELINAFVTTIKGNPITFRKTSVGFTGRNNTKRRSFIVRRPTQNHGNVQTIDTESASRRASLFELARSGPRTNEAIAEILESEEVKTILATMDVWLCDDRVVELDKKDVLGKGQFGTVYRCQYNDRTCACKELKRNATPKEVKQFIIECSQMVSLQHPNLLRMVACHFSKRTQFLITEIAQNGTMLTCILSDRLNLTLGNRLLNMLHGVASGLQFLHTRTSPIVHRDVKLENILVRDNFKPLLSDFGESKELLSKEESAADVSTIVGTPYYMAPEILREEESTTKSDVFSFAMLMLVASTFYHHRMRFTPEFCKMKGIRCMTDFAQDLAPIQLCFGYERKEKVSALQSMKQVIGGWRPNLPKPFERCWPNLAQLIRECWTDNVDERPTSKEVATRLQDIIENVTGKEDDYLGVKTYNLRKYMLARAMRLYAHEQGLDHAKEAGGNGTLSLENQAENAAFILINHTNFFGRKVAASISFCKLDEAFKPIEFFKREDITLNTHKRKCRKVLDGWLCIEYVEVQFPFPLANRICKNICFELFHGTNRVWYSCPISTVPEFSAILSVVPDGWGEDYDDKNFFSTRPIIADFENVELLLSGGKRFGPYATEGNSRTFIKYVEMNLGGYIPKSGFIARIAFKTGLLHTVEQVNLMNKDIVEKTWTFADPEHTRSDWDENEEKRTLHNTEYVLPYWPPAQRNVEGVQRKVDTYTTKEVLDKRKKTNILSSIELNNDNEDDLRVGSQLKCAEEVNAAGVKVQQNRSNSRIVSADKKLITNKLTSFEGDGSLQQILEGRLSYSKKQLLEIKEHEQ